jgi:preprotein translocase subunit SecD
MTPPSRRPALLALLLASAAPFAHAHNGDATQLEIRKVQASRAGAVPPKLILPFGEEELPLDPEVRFTEKDLTEAKPEKDDGVKYMVKATLRPEAAKRFSEFTRKNVGNRIAILVDGQITSAPKIMTEVVGGTLLVAGNLTQEEAARLASTVEQAIRKGSAKDKKGQK